jgi:tRNA (guanine37-N1)-methyltransferase
LKQQSGGTGKQQDAASMVRIEVVTLFPEMVQDAAAYGIIGRALERGIWALDCINPRDFATGSYRTVDDRPYGGGPGMVMLAEPLTRALGAARQAMGAAGIDKAPVIYLSPQGESLGHAWVTRLAAEPGLIMLAGRYEGVDERLLEREIDLELSIGDFVVSGGELPALLLIDAIVRQLPGVLNDAQSNIEESFVDGVLDCPHYTRPEQWAGGDVPAVLLSGNHAEIARWRRKQSLGRTWLRRPDLLAGRELSVKDAKLLEEFKREQGTDKGKR